MNFFQIFYTNLIIVLYLFVNFFDANIPIILIQRNSSNPQHDSLIWNALSIFDKFDILVHNKSHLMKSKIRAARIVLPNYSDDIYPVGGLRLIRLKLEKYQKAFKYSPAFLVANSINQEMAILATELKIPLIGCSKEIGVPGGLGIDQPTWVAPPPIKEYFFLQKFIEKRGYGGCVIFLIESRLISAITSFFTNQFSESLIIAISNNNKTALNLINSRIKKTYVIISFTTENILLELFKSIEKKRKSSIIVLMPHCIYEKLQKSNYSRFKDYLSEVESYVSATLDHSYLYKLQNMISIDDCFSRSFQLIIEAFNMDYKQSNHSICSNYSGSPTKCFTDQKFYKRKKKILQDYVQQDKESENRTLMYTYGFYTYKEIKSVPRLSYYKQKPIAAMTDKEMFVKTAYLKTVSFLQSPYVMVRNLSVNDNCNDYGYGLECYMISMAVENSSKVSEKQKMCCFGLSIDVLAIIRHLDSYTKEFKVATLPNENLLVSNYGLEIEVINRIDSSYGKGVVLAEAHLNNQLLDKLLDFSADLALGSHIVVSKSNHNVSYLTKPYLSTSIALMISRKGNLARYSALTGFLDPFAWSMWLGVFLTIQIAAIASVIYEWHSPYGLTPRGRNRNRIFSFSSALTLCWSILFSHNMATKSPKCWSSRFLINVYACFCVIFLASYTANLAAYMVGEKSLREITGFHDKQIANGNIRLGTILGSGTEFYLRTAQMDRYKFMRLFINPDDAISALRNGIIDAFVYDLEALQFYKRIYYSDKFEIVGKPFAQVSYTIALSKNLDSFGENFSNLLSRIISADGFQKFMDQRVKLWTRELTGVDKMSLLSSTSMEAKNFTGPLLLFCSGIILGFLTLILEYIVYYFVLPILNKFNDNQWCLSISQRLYRHLHSDLKYSRTSYSVRHHTNAETTIVNRLHNHRRFSDDRWINESCMLKYFINNNFNERESVSGAERLLSSNSFQCNYVSDESQNLSPSWIKYLHQINKNPTFMSLGVYINEKAQNVDSSSVLPISADVFSRKRNVFTQTVPYNEEESMKIIKELTDKIWQLSITQRGLTFLLAHYDNKNLMNLKFSEI